MTIHFEKFCGSFKAHKLQENNLMKNLSVLDNMIATRMPSEIGSKSSGLSSSSFMSDHAVLKSMERSHLRKHTSHTPGRQRKGVLRIARTLLVCSSESTMLPVIQRRLCDALWDHSHVSNDIRVLSFESLWLAATRCLVYGRVTKRALQEQFVAVESQGVIQYMELVRAIQWNVARM